MPVAACMARDVSPILRPTRRRPAARFLSRQTPWMAYESSTVASGYRAVIRGTRPRERSASASSSAIALIVRGVSIVAPSSSQGRQTERLVGVLVPEERREGARPVAPDRLLDLREGSTALDELEDALVLVHRLPRTARHEREDRVAHVPEPDPLGVDHLEQPRVGAARVQDVVELLVEGGERPRGEAVEGRCHDVVHGAGPA